MTDCAELIVTDEAKWQTKQTVSFNTRDAIIYSLGIGASELQYAFEHAEDFSVFPTYPIVLYFKGTSSDVCDFPSEAMDEGCGFPKLQGTRVGLDAEKYIEKLKELPTEGGRFTLKQRFTSILQKGKGAVAETEMVLQSEDEQTTYYRMVSSAFLVGAKNFKPAGVPKIVPAPPLPEKKPDVVVELTVSERAAMLYRLSGDYNPLHIDPGMAQMSGFDRPIMHGLGTMGHVAHAVLKSCGGNRSENYKALRCRFSAPVFPGQTLVVEMWLLENGTCVAHQAKEKTSGEVVLSGGALYLHEKAEVHSGAAAKM